jgi:hypothetical protein
MATIDEIQESLHFFFEQTCDHNFVKSKLRFLQTDGEQPLLGYLGCFLLGRFGKKMRREAWVEHMLKPRKEGRIDFLVGKTALEVAVRADQANKSKLLSADNKDEIAKLLRYTEGKAVLALFDYSTSPLQKNEIEESYRDFNPLHGNAYISAYNLLYFSLNNVHRLEIRSSRL